MRAKRYWHIEDRFGYWYATNQFGGFSRFGSESAAREYIAAQVAEHGDEWSS